MHTRDGTYQQTEQIFWFDIFPKKEFWFIPSGPHYASACRYRLLHTIWLHENIKETTFMYIFCFAKWKRRNTCNAITLPFTPYICLRVAMMIMMNSRKEKYIFIVSKKKLLDAYHFISSSFIRRQIKKVARKNQTFFVCAVVLLWLKFYFISPNINYIWEERRSLHFASISWPTSHHFSCCCCRDGCLFCCLVFCRLTFEHIFSSAFIINSDCEPM